MLAALAALPVLLAPLVALSALSLAAESALHPHLASVRPCVDLEARPCPPAAATLPTSLRRATTSTTPRPARRGGGGPAALGLRAGRRTRSNKPLPERPWTRSVRCAEAGGYNLHANVVVREREALGDSLDEAERAALEQALAASHADVLHGRHRPADDVLRELRTRR